MKISDRKMLLSPLWLQTAIITFLLGFAVLGYLALRVSTDHPPIPRQVLTADGSILFTGEDIISGQQIFQKYGLMQYGTIYGHGAYLAPISLPNISITKVRECSPSIAVRSFPMLRPGSGYGGS
nr:hypothetical protein [Geotalea toluenoxydans]